MGQAAIATTLSNALLQNRIAPAYLFTGARGTGKTSSARIFAKSLNCIASDAPTDHPCGVCETCRTITNGSALDVIEIDAASNTGVDNIRELIERAQFAPVQCRYKVYVIDEVHMLSNAAFNALLKTLEEPPDRVVFILATTDPQRVLPTIISRCQRFDFRRIALEPMVHHLSAIALKESIPVTEAALHLIAQISQGGLRDAESLLDQLSLLIGEITAERVWDLVGAVPEQDLMALAEAIASNNPETILDTTRRLMDRGREPLIVLQNFASFYRDLLIAKTATNRGDLVALTPPTWEKLCDFAKNLDIHTILAGQKHLKDSELQLKNTTQPRLWLEVTLLGLLPSAGMAQPPLTVPVAAPPNARSEFKPQRPDEAASIPPEPPSFLAQEASAAAFEEATPLSKPPASPLPDLGDLWQRVIVNIQPPGTQMLLRQQGCLLSFDGEVAKVGIASDKLLNMAQTRISNIKAAFMTTVGAEIKLSLVVAKSGVAAKETTVSETSDAVSRTAISPEPATQSPDSTDNFSEAQPEDLDPAIAPLDDSFSGANPTYQQEWEEDEIARAALNLADAFNGAVVDLESDTSEISVSFEEQVTSLNEAPLDDLEDEEDEDQDDIDF